MRNGMTLPGKGQVGAGQSGSVSTLSAPQKPRVDLPNLGLKVSRAHKAAKQGLAAGAWSLKLI